MRHARRPVGQKRDMPEARRRPEDDPKNTRRRPEEGQKRGMPEGTKARSELGMPEGQEARSEAYQKARSKPRRQERPRPGDLTKESIETEKFQQLEQKNSPGTKSHPEYNPGGGKT